MIASIGLVFTLTGVSIHWSHFNVLPHGDSVLNQLLKPLLMSSLFVDVSFLFTWNLSEYYLCYTPWLNFNHSFFFSFFFLGMANMKENNGKEVVDEANRPETQSQLRPSTGDKMKSLSKMLDLGNLLSRREKKAKHGSLKPGVIKPSLPMTQLSVQIFDVDSSAPIEITPSKTTAPALSQLLKGFL